jgi:peptidylprolyl isomerase
VRRLLALLLTTLLVLLAACSGGDGADGADGAQPRGEFAFPTVSETKPGTEPQIISSTEPPATTQLRVLHEGKGRAVGEDDMLVVDLKGQVWDKDGIDLPAFVNTFKSGQSLIRPIDTVIPAWEQALPGVKVGSRVLLVAPPAEAFEQQARAPEGVFPTDSVMFVIDILDAVAPQTMVDGKPVAVSADPNLPTVAGGKNPKVTVPKTDPPTALVERLLLEGSGTKVAEGETILAQYVGVNWRDGKRFDSSWDPGRHPFAVRIARSDPRTGADGVIEGWVKALVGEKVGSRILVVVPPKLGYGKAGNEDAGIKGTDTVVFVIDILGVYGNATT